MLESSPNHLPPCPRSVERLSSMKLVPGAKKVGGSLSKRTGLMERVGGDLIVHVHDTSCSSSWQKTEVQSENVSTYNENS